MSEFTSATTLDRQIFRIASDENGQVLIRLSVAAASVAGGFTAGHLIHDTCFPQHFVNDRVNDTIQHLQNEEQTTLNLVKQQVLAKPLDIQAIQHSRDRIVAMKTEIKAERSSLPHGYDHNLDSAVSTLGGLAIGAATLFGLGFAANRRIRSAKRRVEAVQ